jgi:hypothetical protein
MVNIICFSGVNFYFGAGQVQSIIIRPSYQLLLMKHLVLFLSFLVPFCLSAQRNYKEGFIVSLKGDTTKGYIDYREWDFSPRTITFKPGLATGEAKEYGITDLRYFAITGKEAYLHSIVKISLDPIKLDDIGAKDTTSKTEAVFLKVVLAGPIVSLLSYGDRIKERFYLLEAGQEQPYELVYREYYTGDSRTTGLFKEDQYRFQLNAVMYSKDVYSAMLADKIQKAEYEERELRKAVLLMNRTVNGDQLIAEGPKVHGSRFFVGAGLAYNQLTFEGEHFFVWNSANTTSSLLPRVSGGVDVFANPNVGRLYFRVELGLHANKTVTKGTKSQTQYTYKMAGLTGSLFPQLMYNLYHSDRLKIPLGVGLGVNYWNYSKNAYQEFYPASGTESQPKEPYFELKRIYTIWMVRAGIVVSDKIEASFLYQPAASLTSYVLYSVGTSVRQVQVSYFLHHKK